MKTITALMAIIATLTAAPTAFGLIGAPTYNPANGHNYYLVGANTWTLAQNASLSLGGNLVTINDAAENAWLKSNFLDPNPSINPWIGLQDLDNNGAWQWISGEPVSYLNWAPGEPNFPHERVSNIFPSSHSLAGLWNNAPDIVAAGVLFGIVEVPEPSGLALGLISCAGFAIARRCRNV
jgi:Lectin C-type domain